MSSRTRLVWAVVTVGLAALAGFGIWSQVSDRGTDSRTHTFGAALALTGPQADFGLKVKEGLDLAVEQVNQEAGFERVRVRYEDTLSTPKDGLTAYRKLISVDGAKFVFGSGSYFANAVAPVADSQDALFFAVGTSLPRITEGRRHVLRYSYTVDISADIIAKHAAAHHKAVAILAVEEEYGRIATDIFRRGFLGADRAVVFQGTFQVKDSEVRTIVQKALQANPDAIFVPGYGPGMVAVIQEIRALRPQMPLLGDVALANLSIIEAAGVAAEGAVVPAMPLDGGIAIDPAAQAFLTSYTARYNKNPDMWTSGAYEALRLLVRAVDETDGSVEAVRRFFVERGPHPSFAGPVEYTPSGESLIPMKLFRIRGGQLKPLD